MDTDATLAQTTVSGIVSSASHDAELTAYLDRVRAHRAELRDSVAAVDEALASPIARGGAWRDRVRAALAELHHDFQDHIDLTEGPGGLYEKVRRASPRLSRQGRPARRASTCATATRSRGFLAVLEHGGTMADLPVFREEVTSLMGPLVRHRQAGSDLVYEAYEVDLGGQG